VLSRKILTQSKPEWQESGSFLRSKQLVKKLENSLTVQDVMSSKMGKFENKNSKMLDGKASKKSLN
jgi:hypothetical protein